MKWRKLENDSDIPEFMDATIELLRPTLHSLHPLERTYFYDWWLRRFNDSAACLLANHGRINALITIPHLPDVHTYRWNSRVLLVRSDQTEPIPLPAEIDLDRSFFLPSCINRKLSDTSVVQNATGLVVQLEYGLWLGDSLDEQLGALPGQITIRRATAGDYEGIIALLERAYTDLSETNAGLHTQREELKRIFEHDFGWCYVACGSGREFEIVGMVSYITMHVPVIGVPGAMVADLAVEPSRRRMGIANALQISAYQQLQQEGFRRVFGYIDPDNKASRKQAESLGRTIWGQAVRFKRRP